MERMKSCEWCSDPRDRAIGTLVIKTLSRWLLTIFMIAAGANHFIPANLNMALNHLRLGTSEIPSWALWARLPLQGVLIAWAWWFTRSEPRRSTAQ
jgi:uncharacterized membrane protein